MHGICRWYRSWDLKKLELKIFARGKHCESRDLLVGCALVCYVSCIAFWVITYTLKLCIASFLFFSRTKAKSLNTTLSRNWTSYWDGSYSKKDYTVYIAIADRVHTEWPRKNSSGDFYCMLACKSVRSMHHFADWFFCPFPSTGTCSYLPVRVTVTVHAAEEELYWRTEKRNLGVR